MSRAARIISDSGVYHILFRGVNQQNIFEEKADYEKLKETIQKIKEEMGFKIYAYCFMSNHVHIVMAEKNKGDISLIMKRILTKYARWYNIKYGRSGALIANRYKSVPVEVDEYFLQLVRYVHQNPIKAAAAENIEDYPYSSYHDYTEEKELVDTEFLMEMISREEFIKYHQEVGEIEFCVTDSNKKTDEDVLKFLRKRFGIENAKSISKMSRAERDKILTELKTKFPVRQLQRITGISRGVITRAE